MRGKKRNIFDKNVKKGKNAMTRRIQLTMAIRNKTAGNQRLISTRQKMTSIKEKRDQSGRLATVRERKRNVHMNENESRGGGRGRKVSQHTSMRIQMDGCVVL
jgi:hypothetical protein